MNNIKLSDEAKDVLEKLISVFPLASRESCRQKIMKGIDYQLLKQSSSEATKDILLKALEETLAKSFEPVILKFKSPEKLSGIVASQKQVDKENPAVRIKRWDIPALNLDVQVKNVFALMASPRKNGNTDCIMDAFLEGISESGCNIEKKYISDLKISPCIGCMACEKKELETFCAIKDDMTDLYRKFIEYDAFVMGFPVYTGRECSQASAFFDRLKALRTKGHFQKLSRKRKGALVVTWGWPSEDSYDHVVENAMFILKLFGMDTAEVVTGSGFWEAYYEKGTARLDKNGMADAKEAGRALVK